MTVIYDLDITIKGANDESFAKWLTYMLATIMPSKTNIGGEMWRVGATYEPVVDSPIPCSYNVSLFARPDDVKLENIHEEKKLKFKQELSDQGYSRDAIIHIIERQYCSILDIDIIPIGIGIEILGFSKKYPELIGEITKKIFTVYDTSAHNNLDDEVDKSTNKPLPPQKPEVKEKGGTKDQWFDWYHAMHDAGYKCTFGDIAELSHYSEGYLKQCHRDYKNRILPI